ncbi:MAG: leucine-rich repeat domain-containing protein [Bacteroidales bacterium]|nr:leucine-rich repeat domain-containing protein [Bacteroidales bacterium]
MKKLSSIFSFVMVMLLGCLSASAQYHYDFSAVNAAGDTLCYNITSDSTVEVTSCADTAYVQTPFGQTVAPEYYHYDPVVEIPASVSHNGVSYQVTRIGNKAFIGQKLIQSVILPPSITSIGNCAMLSCDSLRQINLPNVEQLGIEAFRYTQSLTHIDLPNSLRQIGEACFYGSGLQEVEVPGSIDTILPLTFAYCTSLRRVVLHEGLRGIGEHALYSTQTDTLVFPRSMRWVEQQEVLGNYETQFNLPLRHLEFQFDSDHPDEKVHLAEGCFYYCNYLNTLVLSENTELSVGCFGDCIALTTLVVPDGITSIPTNCFGGCISLETVSLPNSLVSIGDRAFQGCQNLKEITLPPSVTAIGDHAFKSSTSGLDTVTLLSAVPPALGEQVFLSSSNPDRAIRFNIPCYTMGAYTSAPGWSELAAKPNVTFHENCVGIVGHDMDNSTHVWPNPTEGRVQVQSAGSDIRSVEVYDISGRQLFSLTANGTTADVDLSGIGAGVYLLRVTLSDGTVTSERIVKK